MENIEQLERKLHPHSTPGLSYQGSSQVDECKEVLEEQCEEKEEEKCKLVAEEQCMTVNDEARQKCTFSTISCVLSGV